MKSSTLFVLLLTICVTLLLPVQTTVHAQKGVTPERLPFPNSNDEFDTLLQMRAHAAAATRLDPDRLQREARELLELSQSLQPDLQHVKQGLLPKDTIAKLKRIEKLSKQLRGELGQ